MASVSAHPVVPRPFSRRKAAPSPRPGFLALVALLAALLAVVPLPVRAAEPGVRLADEVFAVTRSDAAVDVLQLFTLVNEGDGVAERPLLPIAEDAVRLRILPLEGGGPPLVERLGPGEPPRDPADLAPGERRVYQATYRLWQSGWPLVLKRPLPYASGGATLLTRPGELEVTGLKVAHAGVDQVEGVTLDVYRVGAVEPVDRWQVLLRPAGGVALPVLAGAQARDPLDALPGASRWWLPGLAAVVAALLWTVRRRVRPLVPGPPPEAGGEESLAPWVDRLAALDLAFQRGELAEEPYRQEREALLAAFRRETADPSAPAAPRAGLPGDSVDRV